MVEVEVRGQKFEAAGWLDEDDVYWPGGEDITCPTCTQETGRFHYCPDICGIFAETGEYAPIASVKCCEKCNMEKVEGRFPGCSCVCNRGKKRASKSAELSRKRRQHVFDSQVQRESVARMYKRSR